LIKTRLQSLPWLPWKTLVVAWHVCVTPLPPAANAATATAAVGHRLRRHAAAEVARQVGSMSLSLCQVGSMALSFLARYMITNIN